MKKLYVIIAVIILLSCNAFAEVVPKSWIAPTENTDGSTLTDLAGFKLVYGLESGNYTKSIDVGNVIQYDLILPDNGKTYFINVKAYDTSGNESVVNGEVTHTTTYIDSLCPKAPMGLQ